MLSMVFLVLPGAFGLLIWNAYRSDRRGDGFQPRSGAQRWIERDPD